MPYLRIVVTGLIAQYPLGGVTWDYLQYVLGLARLGHDVYYFEDSGQWPYNPTEDGLGKTCDYNVDYLAAVMTRFGLENRWAYRFPWEDQWHGLSDGRRREVIETADLLVNVSGTLERPQEYRSARRLAYIDTDPVFTQVKIARGQQDFRRMIDFHDVHFSFGERLPGNAPDSGHTWHATRQPIVLSEWHPETKPRDVFTTVMNWTSYKPVAFNGHIYGQKDLELQRFLDLPARVAPTVLEHRGWRLVDPMVTCPDLDSYRRYIETSKAEWSVAKHGYVEGQSGWFSCRSACYLAAGRPVVVQDTGFSSILPVGEGIIPFSSIDEAMAGIHDVEENYARHSRAARSFAEEWFDAGRVLSHLVDIAMAPTELVANERIS
jgi:hypothetical protein